MAEPQYDTPIYAVHDGRDPPVPRRMHYEYKSQEIATEGTTPTGNLIVNVYYGNTNDKLSLLADGAHGVDPTTGYEMGADESCNYAFMRVTFRGWRDKTLGQFSFIANPME